MRTRFDRVRARYGINVRRGMRVLVRTGDVWMWGTVTSIDASDRILIRPQGWPRRRVRVHPLDNDNWDHFDTDNWEHWEEE